MTNDHERFREQLALRLYGELSPLEAAELDAHLQTCAECGVLEHELASGLGALVAHGGARAHDDLPAGWLEMLETRIGARADRAVRPRTLFAFAAGLAAGAVAALALGRSAPAAPLDRGGFELVASALAYSSNAAAPPCPPRFTEPPPPATSHGQLAELRSALRR